MTPPALDAYQLGWICALPIEVAAAELMLDENFGMLDEQDSADTNSYTLGRVGRHYVAIAGLPGGLYGTTSATTVAINMMRTFSQSLRIGLMVGIGGGIPSANNDIRLGDVVVSYPDGTSSGVLQYDFGKVVEDGKFQRGAFLNSPPRSLLTAVAKMRAAELVYDPCYPDYIEKAVQRTNRTRRNFGRPNVSTDRLFQVNFEHPTSTAGCDMCPLEWEEARNTRDEDGPQTHYGIIASGNAVIKHAATRERLRQETGALCFDMEAAGLMMDFPCIIIRGICDYADSHKNKLWQGYAAIAAASYAKEFLSYIPIGQVSQEKLVAESCNKIADEVKEVSRGIERAFHQQEDHHYEKMIMALTKEQQECHQAFKTSVYEQYKNINPDRAEGTCQWILENSQYLDWQGTSHNDLLWISADPGCGKSVLAKSLIDFDLRFPIPVSICYFFFKDNEEQDSLITALCAVLHQLFRMQPHLTQHALPSWRTNGEKIQQEVDELWRILMATVLDPAFSSTICIFDGLDECKPRDRAYLIEKLGYFYARSHSSVQQSWFKFLVTSRPYDEIHERFYQVTQLFPHIHIRGEEENDRIREEISLVMKLRVAELRESLHLSLEMQRRLERQLFKMEHRTYLWLYLAVDDIRTTFQNSLQPEEESVELIPNSVSAAYERILSRVPSDKVLDVKVILQIIVSARRPLTIEEMALALGVARGSRSGTTANAGLNPKGLGRKIRQLCGLFVFINNSRVYLIHQTAREFLVCNEFSKPLESPLAGFRWKQSIRPTDSHRVLAEVCVRVIHLLSYETSALSAFGPVERWTEEFVRDHPLIEYAAKNWVSHLRLGDMVNELSLLPIITSICDPDTNAGRAWLKVYWSPLSYRQDSALSVTAYFGLTEALRTHLSKVQPSDLNKRSRLDGRTALFWAAQSGHEGAVRLLLDKTINVTSQDILGQTAVFYAVKAGHVNIVKLILEGASSSGSQLPSSGMALHCAVELGHKSIAALLLDHKSNVNSKNQIGQTTLTIAAISDNAEMVRLLLDRGADVRLRDMQGKTALRYALERKSNRVVKLLLDAGSELEQKDIFGVELMRCNPEVEAIYFAVLRDVETRITTRPCDGI